jgi:uncharacterized protein (UPF0276 family)
VSASPSTEAPFAERVAALPQLGLGISTEYEAGKHGLDPLALHRAHPELVQFLEVGADLERGLDDDARAWAAAGWPTTYHFLDVNLEESEDLTREWTQATVAAAQSLGAAWLCGDAGLWHLGVRDLGHGILMPPVLEPESAAEMARNVRRLRHWAGMEVLPENPPAHVFLGRMHLADYFASVAEQADCGLLLDAAHLAAFQIVSGHDPLKALDRFPAERIVEMHVAGGRRFEHEGASFVEDDHGVDVLPETWAIVEELIPRATNLRALVFECERNRAEQVLPTFERLAGLLTR